MMELGSINPSSLDYFFFLFGLSYTALFAVAFFLMNQRDIESDEIRPPWGWLASFAGLYGTSSWLAGLSITLESTLYNWPRLIVLFFAYLALLRFAMGLQNLLSGSEIVPKFRKRLPAILLWSTLLLWILSTSLGLQCRLSAHLWVRATLGLPVLVWLGFQFLELRKKSGNHHFKWASYFCFAEVVLGAATLPLLGLVSDVLPQNENTQGMWIGVITHFVRGLFVIAGSLGLWRAYGLKNCIGSYRRTLEAPSERDPETLRLQQKWQFFSSVTLGAMVVLLLAGWVVVRLAGNYARTNVEIDNDLRAHAAMSLIGRQLEALDYNALMLANTIASLPKSGASPETPRIVMDRICRTLPDSACYLLNLEGQVIATSNKGEVQLNDLNTFKDYSFYRLAKLGNPAQQFGRTSQQGKVEYFSSQPVRSVTGEITGVLAIRSGLDNFESVWNTESPLFVADARGIVLYSSISETVLRPLWNIPKERRETLRQNYLYDEQRMSQPLFSGPLVNNAIVAFHQKKHVVSMEPFPSLEGLVLYRLESAHLISLYRLIGIVCIWAIAMSMLVGGIFMHQVLSHSIWIFQERKRGDRQKREMELKLFHADKLATIGTLAAGVAHEINNPLSVISFYLDSFEEQFKETFEGEEREKQLLGVEKLRKAVFRIAGIVNGLRTYARSDTDHMSEVNLAQVVEDTVSLVAHIYGKMNIFFQTNFDEGEHHILGNIGKLQQVVMNLVANARDALKEREGGIIQLQIKSTEDSVVLIVADNGAGIPKKVLERLFEPFFTTKPVGVGTGLGLSISQSIVQSHGGTMVVDSEVNFGTAFTLTFPRFGRFKPELSQVIEAPKKTENVQYRLKGRVLIVDDEEDIRFSLSRMLTDMGMQVETAANGLQALEILETKNFDLVITDLRMPHLDGVALIQEIRIRNSTKPKIIVITAGIVTEYTQEQRDVIRQKAEGYMTKPFTKQAIYRLIHRLT